MTEKLLKGVRVMDKQALDFAARVLQNLPDLESAEMQSWIDNPRGLQDALKIAFRPPESKLKTWKTIKLGTPGFKTADDFRAALTKGGYKIGDWASDTLGKPAFTVSETEMAVDLVVVFVAELGFKNGATREDIYEKAQSLGLKLCPTEVGPQLRLQYGDQPKGEWLLIAMEPIADSGGGLRVFYVEHDGGERWLHGHSGDPYNFWLGSVRWVFRLRK